jgi:hypothetical protein
MSRRKLVVGAAALALGTAGTGAAVAATHARTVPKRANIDAVQKVKVKINRFIQDGVRWQKDTYFVRHNGTLHVVNKSPGEGGHSFTVVKEKDLPKTVAQINRCKICQTLGQAHGANPNSEGPPQFLYLENGKGQNTPPNVDRPGDSAFIADKRNATVNLKITAKKGKTLYFMCLIHPWMQAKIKVR